MTATISEHVYQEIRKMLSKSELLPGQRVSQLRLARRMNCSPLPVVEALRRLESDGLIVKEPRKIARVRKISTIEVADMYLLRESIEAVSARLAAQRITPEEVEKLVRLGEEFEESCAQGMEKRNADLERKIHLHIAHCAHFSMLHDQLQNMVLIEQTAMRHEHWALPHESYRTSHRALIKAIVDHDGDSAEYLMRKHLQKGAKEIMGVLSDNSPTSRRRS